MFTDTRAYSSPNGFYAATGRVTVALSDNNHTGTILRPLIVIEGYDASTVQTMKKRYAHRLGPAKTKPGIVPNA